jgi:hypothetical protein
MTYNFDPERWYENERSAIARQRVLEGWGDQQYERAIEELDRRYEEMVLRIEGTYQIPKGE